MTIKDDPIDPNAFNGETKKVHCPECNHRWIRYACKAKSLECRTCNCLFIPTDNGVQTIRSGVFGKQQEGQ